MVGKTFGRLTIVSRAENARSGNAVYNYRCACGGEGTATGSNLRTGKTRSCGCLLDEWRRTRCGTNDEV